MKLRYSLVNKFREFICFAFYPKTTLIVCSVISLIVIGVLVSAMMLISDGSKWYDILFAFTTGATGSFFVSIVIEISNNYRNNMRAWFELNDYYNIIVSYVLNKKKDPLLYETNDVITVTWRSLSDIIPVFKQISEKKREFLSDSEIQEIEFILQNYHYIRKEVKSVLQKPPMFYDALNYPDTEILGYPNNILNNMPDWMKCRLASDAELDAIDRLTDSVMKNNSILFELMHNYDISAEGIAAYDTKLDDENIELDKDIEYFDDEDLDYYEPEEPKEHRQYRIDIDKAMLQENIPLVSCHISTCCLEISKSMSVLEQILSKKPLYWVIIKHMRGK